jgi:excinuclease ABC subunit C
VGESLAERAESLPTGPGVYLFKSRRGTVLYVGKAQNLRARVKQYVGGGDGRIRIPALMERASDVSVLLTPTVKDALLLENELIKRHRPRFNVRLRDDKQYLALRLDPNETWPRLREVRRFARDGAEYFGPYTSSASMKEAVSNLRRIFPLRSCSEGTFKDYARRGRPCIEYEMKRCLGPCCGLVDEADYGDLVRGTALFLRGRSDELVDRLKARMARAAESEDFEQAARLRDRIGAVERTVQRQQIVVEKPVERDVFALAREGGEVAMQVLHVREGRVIGAEDFAFSDVAIDDGEVISSFLGQYYGSGGEENARKVPREVLTAAPADDADAVAEWLSEKEGRRIGIRTPQRGASRELVAIAERNAELALERRLGEWATLEATLEELREKCHLACPPRHIECYDVSTLAGTLAVASRVVFQDGRPDKSRYRRYRIKDAPAGDDYACLREVLTRRLRRVESEPLPDLLMVDGGRGQLGVVRAALEDAKLEVDTLGIAKERDEQSRSGRVKRGGGLKAERVFLAGRANPVALAPSSKALLLLQRVRDESHRFAIEFQRELRSKANFVSILEELPGIGPGKRRSLLKHFGSLRAIRRASAEELLAAPGISRRDADTISGFFARAVDAREERS